MGYPVEPAYVSVDPGDEVLDPSDPTSLTLGVARSNPSAYASRFALLPEAKRTSWLTRASVSALRVHFDALRRARGDVDPLRARLHVREGTCTVHAFASPQTELPFARAVALVTQTRRLARALGLRFLFEVDVDLSELWTEGKLTVSEIVPVRVALQIVAPYTMRGEPLHGEWIAELVWTCRALGAGDHVALLARGETNATDHAHEIAAAVARAGEVATTLRVPFTKSNA